MRSPNRTAPRRRWLVVAVAGLAAIVASCGGGSAEPDSTAAAVSSTPITSVPVPETLAPTTVSSTLPPTTQPEAPVIESPVAAAERSFATPEELTAAFSDALYADDPGAAANLPDSAAAAAAFDYLNPPPFGPAAPSCFPQSGSVRECEFEASTPSLGLYLLETNGTWRIVSVGFCGDCAGPFNDEDLTATFCVVDTTPLNLRIGPGTEFPVITTIPVGDCSVAGLPDRVETSAEGRPWRVVTWGGFTGFVADSKLARQS